MPKWSDITIEMLQEIAAFKTENPIERTAHDISVITKTPLSEVETWTLDKLNGVDVKFLNKLPNTKLKFKFKHKGKRFKLIKNAKQMKAHHFIELQEVVKGDIVENLPTIIALLSNRVNWRGKPIEDDYDWKVENFKDLPCPQFYSYAVFFSLLYPKLLNATLSYLKEKGQEIKQELSDGLASSTDSQGEDDKSGTAS